MWGHSTYLDDEGLHVRVSQTRTRRRNRLHYEAAQRLRAQEEARQAQAGDTQNIMLGGDALAHDEPLDLGLPEADIEDDDVVPGSGWRRALPDEPYPMNILLVAGGRGPARYLRFILDAEDRPTVLGSEGRGRPAYSSGLYANPQPIKDRTSDDDSLELYDAQHASRHDIDLAFARLSDPGVCADVIRFRKSAQRKEQLLGRMHNLERQWGDWAGKARSLDRRLKAANIPSRIEQFLPEPLPAMLTKVALNYADRLGARITAHADEDDGPAAMPVPLPPAVIPPPAPQPPAPSRAAEQPRLAGEEQVYQNPPCVYCTTTEHLSFECRTPHERCIIMARCIVPITHVHRRTFCAWQEHVAGLPLPVDDPPQQRPPRPTPYTRRRTAAPAHRVSRELSPPRQSGDTSSSVDHSPVRRRLPPRGDCYVPTPHQDDDEIDWRRYTSHIVD
ncbi:hypothetical protein EDB85DRAFT_1893075 [Lactarius pseudohatsudake]|nr:hypothetical protein EDB85DRAFT_1893075 [Lactarius pseudohatsudake]